jgi:putative resolvase
MSISFQSKYVTGSTIKKEYGVSTQSLHRWEEEGLVQTIRSPGGNRLYNRSDIKKLFGKSTGEEEEKTKKRVCYARVSSEKQRPDLECQIQDLKRKKPEYEILSDIGSGLNFKRRNFQRLLEQVHNGNIEEVVVTHKGILTFFFFFFFFFEY